MNVTFLGTSGIFPTAERGLPSVAVRRGRELILFDCGEGTQRQMSLAKVGFKPEMRILVSHLHGDHILGIPGLLQTMSLFNRKHLLRIYGPKGIYDFIKCVKETVRLGLTFPVEVYEVSEGLVYSGREYSLQSAWVEHTVPCLAYALVENTRAGRFYPEKAVALGVPQGSLWSKLQHGLNVKLLDGHVVRSDEVVGAPRRGRKIVYAMDTRPCDAVVKLAKDGDILIHEATFEDSLIEKADSNFHSTPKQAAEIAKKAQVEKLLLTHISGRYSNLDKFLDGARLVFPKVEVAKDLLSIEVPYSD